MTTEAPFSPNTPKNQGSLNQSQGFPTLPSPLALLGTKNQIDHKMKATQQTADPTNWADRDVEQSDSEDDKDTEGEQIEETKKETTRQDSASSEEKEEEAELIEANQKQDGALENIENDLLVQKDKGNHWGWRWLAWYWNIWTMVGSTIGSWVYVPGQQTEFTNFKVAFTGVFIKILTTFIIDHYQRDTWGLSTIMFPIFIAATTFLILDKWMPMVWQWLNEETGIEEKCSLVALTVILLILYPVDKCIALLVSSTFGAFGVKFSAPWCNTQ